MVCVSTTGELRAACRMDEENIEFYQNFAESLTDLDFRHASLGDAGVAALARVLPRLINLRRLILRDNSQLEQAGLLRRFRTCAGLLPDGCAPTLESP